MTKMYKMMFFLFLVSGTLIVISSYSWMGMWLGLEINLLSIIPILSNNKNILSSESALKYFVTQALASTIFLFSVILMMTESNVINNMQSNSYLMMILNSALLAKMGAAPFHFWFPEVMEGLNWANCLIMLTWQKIAPMILLIYNVNMIMFMSTIIIFSMTVSGILGINQTSLRKIMAYSSINHIAWMISSMMFFESIWLLYFLIYSIITINIVLVFKKFNIYYMKQLFSSFNNNASIKLFFILNFLSLGGLPPFLGFFPKWMTIQMMIENKMFIIPVTMVVMTLITLFFYMRITFSTILMNSSESNWNLPDKTNPQKINLIMTFNMISMLGMILCTLVFNWL